MDKDLCLHVVDYVVIVVVLLVPLGIGALFAVKDFRHATRDEYLLGGRQMSMLPVTLSIFATYMSAISFLGIPTEVYSFGPMFVTCLIGWALTFLVVAFQFVPLFYPLKITSLYEYLELRFESKLVRAVGVALGILQTLGFMSIALLAPALALQAGAGLPIWLSVGIVGVIGTIYTSVGGIKSVMWTDTFQSVIMFICIFSVIIKGTMAVGGGSNAWILAEEGGRTSFNSFNPDPRTRHTWWSTIIGGAGFWFGMACNQSGVQRISAMRSAREAKAAFLINSLLVIIYGASLLAVGLVIYSYFYYIKCDPFKSGIIKNRNQLSLYFVMHAFQGTLGMAGLYMAAVFSSALSTISSGINSLAANTVEDILKRPLSKVTESTATIITKIVVSAYGALIIGLAYAANSLEGPVTQLSTTANSACGGPLFGIILLGTISPWTNKYGALGGVIIGLAFNLWIALGYQIYGGKAQTLPAVPGICFSNNSGISFESDNMLNITNTLFINPHNESALLEVIDAKSSSSLFFYNISYEWYGFIGIGVTLFFGIVISLCTMNYSKPSTRHELLLPCLRRFWTGSSECDHGKDKCMDSSEQNVKMLPVDKIESFKTDNPNKYIDSEAVKLKTNYL